MVLADDMDGTSSRNSQDAGAIEVLSFNGDRTDWLFERLRVDILSGVIPAGQKISEPKIARRFNMSRAPIREAIRRLEERRLVIRSSRTGARVIVLSQEEVADLVMMREHLEGLAAGLAAENMSTAEIRVLREIIDGRTRDLQRHENINCIDVDRDFHAAVAKGSKSAELERLLARDYFFRFRLLHQQSGWTPQSSLKGQAEHLRIVEAIEARDSALASLLMKRHISVAMARYINATKSVQPVA